MASTKDQVVFAVSTDEARAIQGFQKLIDKQKRLDQGAQKASRSFKEQKKESEGAAASVGRYAKGLLTVGAASTALAGTAKLLKEHRDLLDAIADKANASASGMKGLASILPAGVQGKTLQKQVAQIGALFGVQPDAAATMASPIISALNQGDTGVLDRQELMKIYGSLIASAQASQIGLDANLAGQAEVSGATRGMRPGEAVGSVLEAAGLSAWDPKDFAAMVPGLAGWKNMQSGLAAGVAMSQVFTDPGVAKELAQSAGKILGPSGVTNELIKKYGLEDANEQERIAALAGIAAREGKGATAEARVQDWTGRLNSIPGVDEQSARALSAIIQNVATFQSALKELQTGDPRAVTGQMLARIRQTPQMQSALLAEQSAARASYMAMYGPQASSARAETSARARTGAELQQQGWAAGSDFSTGESSWLGYILSGKWAGTGPAWNAPGGAPFSPPSMGAKAASAEATNEAAILDKQTAVLEKIEANTRANQAPQGGRPSPPAQPRNAQI